MSSQDPPLFAGTQTNSASLAPFLCAVIVHRLRVQVQTKKPELGYYWGGCLFLRAFPQEIRFQDSEEPFSRWDTGRPFQHGLPRPASEFLTTAVSNFPSGKI